MLITAHMATIAANTPTRMPMMPKEKSVMKSYSLGSTFRLNASEPVTPAAAIAGFNMVFMIIASFHHLELYSSTVNLLEYLGGFSADALLSFDDLSIL